jgi:hypothetical protein
MAGGGKGFAEGYGKFSALGKQNSLQRIFKI